MEQAEKTAVQSDEQVLMSEAQEPTNEVLSEEATTAEAMGEVEQLKAQVAQLQAELSNREEQTGRAVRECREFEQYFSDVSLQSVPDEVWEQVQQGIPLAAAYALYEKKSQHVRQRRLAEERAQALCSPGVPGESPRTEYFSPSEVRAMSPKEVRQNYDRIFESMRHWQ